MKSFLGSPPLTGSPGYKITHRNKEGVNDPFGQADRIIKNPRKLTRRCAILTFTHIDRIDRRDCRDHIDRYGRIDCPDFINCIDCIGFIELLKT